MGRVTVASPSSSSLSLSLSYVHLLRSPSHPHLSLCQYLFPSLHVGITSTVSASALPDHPDSFLASVLFSLTPLTFSCYSPVIFSTFLSILLPLLCPSFNSLSHLLPFHLHIHVSDLRSDPLFPMGKINELQRYKVRNRGKERQDRQDSHCPKSLADNVLKMTSRGLQCRHARV